MKQALIEGLKVILSTAVQIALDKISKKQGGKGK